MVFASYSSTINMSAHGGHWLVFRVGSSRVLRAYFTITTSNTETYLRCHCWSKSSINIGDKDYFPRSSDDDVGVATAAELSDLLPLRTKGLFEV